MGSSQLLSIIFVVYTISLSFGLINCRDNNGLVTNQAALFVFGDSLFDAGNNNYIDTFSRFRANIWPYGRTTFKSPTGRISDGRLIPDFLAEYAWLPLIPPNLQPSNGNNQFTYGLNFASGGAGTLVGTFPGMVIDLGTQLSNFKDVEKSLRYELGDIEAKKVFSRAVYLFHIGGNDYVYPILFANSSTFESGSKETLSDFVIGNLTAVIEEVYKIGGRKFGFLNVGSYDCAPGSIIIDRTKIGSCYKPLTYFINMHNKKLPNMLKRLEHRLPGFKYALHDYHTSLSERINNPVKYGKPFNYTSWISKDYYIIFGLFCCGIGPLRGINTCGGRVLGVLQGYELCENVTEYLFFDAFHLTEKAHRQIAELIWSGPSNVTRPYNLKTLFESK